MDLTVCERWRLTTADLGDRAQPWFLDWVRREPEQVSRHLTAGFMAYGALQQLYGHTLETAREYFGGIGAQTMMIQELLRPQFHSVIDISPDAALMLGTGLREPGLWSARADAYAPESYAEAELVGLDFGDLTAWRLRPGQKQRELLDRVMSRPPKAVVLTDIAGPRLHLHRERYAQVLGVPPDRLTRYDVYLACLSDWIRAHYEYALLAGYWHRWSAVGAFVPVHHVPPEDLSRPWTPVSDDLKGLTVHG